MKLFDLFKAGLIETVLAVCQPFIIHNTHQRFIVSANKWLLAKMSIKNPHPPSFI